MGCSHFNKSVRVNLCTAFEQAFDAVIIHEIDGRIVAVNQAMLEALGVTREQALRYSVLQDLSVDGKGGPDVSELWQKALLGTPQCFEWMLKRPGDGTIVDLEVHLRRIDTPQGPLLMATTHDITERKRSSRKLQQSLSLLQTIIEASRAGIMVIGMDGGVKFCNRNLIRMWGIPAEVEASMSDDRFFECMRAKFKDPGKVQADVEAALAGRAGKFSQVIELTDGRVIERESEPHRLDGEMVGMLLTFRDITEKVRAEAEKDRIRQQLMHASKLASIGTLAGGIAHEINNPLTILRGNNQLLRKALEGRMLLDTQMTRLLDGVEKNIGRIAAIIAGMRMFARVDSELAEPQSVHQIIQESLVLMMNIYAKGGIAIETSLASGNPTVLGSRGKLQQIIVNLVSNARDALEGREHQGAVIRIATRDAGDQVVLEVSDNGCGIPQDKIEQIFDPFYTTKPPGKGTGLGLAIIQSAVTAMGGKIEVDSIVGTGSTFRIAFPRHTG